MTQHKSSLEKELSAWLSDARRVVVTGVGNPIRMDDYVGVKIVEYLRGKVSENVLLIECETVPESYTMQIIEFNPTHIIIIDAAILGLKPGDARLVHPNKLKAFPAISTHTLPLRVFCDYLAEMTEAKIGLLLIEPQKTDFGEGLTPEVSVSAEKIARILVKSLENV